MRKLFLGLRTPIGVGPPGGVERGPKNFLCMAREPPDGRRQVVKGFVRHYTTARAVFRFPRSLMRTAAAANCSYPH